MGQNEMTIRKRIEQEIEKVRGQAKNSPSNTLAGYLAALGNVLEWMDTEKIKRKPRFVKPTARNLFEAFRDKGLGPREADLEAQAFLDYFESCGWVIGGKGKKMVSWKSAVATWMRNKKADKPEKNYYPETQSERHKEISQGR